jgi:hypothetical protein
MNLSAKICLGMCMEFLDDTFLCIFWDSSGPIYILYPAPLDETLLWTIPRGAVVEFSSELLLGNILLGSSLGCRVCQHVALSFFSGLFRVIERPLRGRAELVGAPPNA